MNKQDVIINLEIETEVPEAAMSADEPLGIFDYKVITKKIIDFVETGHFKLLEVLAQKILLLVKQEELVRFARVEVDKPGALRHTDSVSVEMEASR